MPVKNSKTFNVGNDPSVGVGGASETRAGQESGWTEVKRKKAGYMSGGDASPSPPITFRNLKCVDEIEGRQAPPAVARPVLGPSTTKASPVRLTRSQKKRLKAARGSFSPLLS